MAQLLLSVALRSVLASDQTINLLPLKTRRKRGRQTRVHAYSVYTGLTQGISDCFIDRSIRLQLAGSMRRSCDEVVSQFLSTFVFHLFFRILNF